MNTLLLTISVCIAIMLALIVWLMPHAMPHEQKESASTAVEESPTVNYAALTNETLKDYYGFISMDIFLSMVIVEIARQNAFSPGNRAFLVAMIEQGAHRYKTVGEAVEAIMQRKLADPLPKNVRVKDHRMN